MSITAVEYSQASQALNIVSTIASVFSIAASMIALYCLWKSPFKNKRNSKWIMIAQVANMILQPMQIIGVWCTVDAAAVDYSKAADVFLGNVQSLIGVVNVGAIVLIDLDVLTMFSALDQRIVNILPQLRPAISILLITIGSLTLIFNALATARVTGLESITFGVSLSYGILGITYDNIQTIYICYLVHTFSKETAAKGESSCVMDNEEADLRKLARMYRIVGMIIGTCVIDWAALFATACFGFDSDSSSFVVSIVGAASGIHVAFIALILIQLQKLALDKVVQKRKQMEMEHRKHASVLGGAAVMIGNTTCAAEKATMLLDVTIPAPASAS